ncbi:hypothetical protein HDE_09264 [Halotydeus destructor]|nr:hypothetical protein HDE_09264 [Halotydeus destructor]
MNKTMRQLKTVWLKVRLNMVLRYIMHWLSARYGSDMVQKLADANGMRKVARVAAHIILRTQASINENLEKKGYSASKQEMRRLADQWKKRIDDMMLEDKTQRKK